MLYEMAMNPEVAKKARAEVDEWAATKAFFDPSASTAPPIITIDHVADDKNKSLSSSSSSSCSPSSRSTTPAAIEESKSSWSSGAATDYIIPDADDLKAFPYLDRIVTESLRLWSAVPSGTTRVADRDM
jgi:cytochrome P450